MEIFVKDFDEIMNSFEVGQAIIAQVTANAKVKTGVASVHNFEVSELKERESAKISRYFKATVPRQS